MTTHNRRAPIRTCVICGSKAAKRELMRIVAMPDGAVKMDPTGKAPGRGAYVCGGGGCLQQGMKRGRLEHALRARLKDEEWAELVSSLGALGGSQ